MKEIQLNEVLSYRLQLYQMNIILMEFIVKNEGYRR